MALVNSLNNLANSLSEGLNSFTATTANAAAQANAESRASQSAQGAFNQASANQANAQNIESMMNQYQFNSAQASMANAFTENMWQRSADWNEAMWEKQAAFNAEQAEIQRNWAEKMSNTQYQRAINDMEKAGLNPILSVTGGAGVPNGAAATVGGSSIGSAQGAMAQGGLLGANAASEGMYQGQLEQISGTLGLLSAMINGGMTIADSAAGLGPEIGKDAYEFVGDIVDGAISGDINVKDIMKLSLPGQISDALEKAAKWTYNKLTGEKEKVVDGKTFDNITRTQQRMNNYNRFKGEVHG